jgi:hypothetical protein
MAPEKRNEEQFAMSTAQSPEPPAASPASPFEATVSRKRTLQELAAEQGVVTAKRAEELLGQGEDLWDDDAEFDRFLTWLRESRRSGE